MQKPWEKECEERRVSDALAKGFLSGFGLCLLLALVIGYLVHHAS
jgi:hypothetical protein